MPDARAFAVAPGRRRWPDRAVAAAGPDRALARETWRGGDLASGVFGAAIDALRACRTSAARLTTAEPDRVSAVLDWPRFARLSAGGPAQQHHQRSYCSPRAHALPAWPGAPTTQVFDAMSAPLCAAYLASCG